MSSSQLGSAESALTPLCNSNHSTHSLCLRDQSNIKNYTYCKGTVLVAGELSNNSIAKIRSEIITLKRRELVVEYPYVFNHKTVFINIWLLLLFLILRAIPYHKSR